MTFRKFKNTGGSPRSFATDSVSFDTAAKWAFTTRRVDRAVVSGLSPRVESARPGDLVLARVERIGSHANLQLATGRRSALYPGDLIVAACGARYAPDQYEGVAELPTKGADLLAGGGIIGRMRAQNGRMSGPTRVVPLGLLCGPDEAVINLADHALAPRARPQGPVTIAVIGAAMNAGKTTAVSALTHGLTRAGLRVATIKATGTGASGDHYAYVDAGAHWVGDFTDTGMASTYLEPLPRIMTALDTLLGHAGEADCNVAVIELGDGVFQRETEALIRAPEFAAALDGMIFAAPDAASAVGGLDVLGGWGVQVDAITGLLARSPMATTETRAATGQPVITRAELCDPAFAGAFLARLGGESSAMRGAIPINAAERLTA